MKKELLQLSTKFIFVDDNGVITIAPHIGASVEAKVLQHLKGDKVIVQKKKKRIQKRNGHRQFHQIVIEGITAAGAKKLPKKEAVAANTEEVPKVKKVSKAKKRRY
jgi:large subunit ribosomal protein L21